MYKIYNAKTQEGKRCDGMIKKFKVIIKSMYLFLKLRIVIVEDRVIAMRK